MALDRPATPHLSAFLARGHAEVRPSRIDRIYRIDKITLLICVRNPEDPCTLLSTTRLSFKTDFPESEQAGNEQQRGDRAGQKAQTDHHAELHVGSNFRQQQHGKTRGDRSGADADRRPGDFERAPQSFARGHALTKPFPVGRRHMDRKIQSDAERDAREHRVGDSQRRARERQRGEHQEQAEGDGQDGDESHPHRPEQYGDENQIGHKRQRNRGRLPFDQQAHRQVADPPVAERHDFVAQPLV